MLHPNMDDLLHRRRRLLRSRYADGSNRIKYRPVHIPHRLSSRTKLRKLIFMPLDSTLQAINILEKERLLTP